MTVLRRHAIQLCLAETHVRQSIHCTHTHTYTRNTYIHSILVCPLIYYIYVVQPADSIRFSIEYIAKNNHSCVHHIDDFFLVFIIIIIISIYLLGILLFCVFATKGKSISHTHTHVCLWICQVLFSICCLNLKMTRLHLLFLTVKGSFQISKPLYTAYSKTYFLFSTPNWEILFPTFDSDFFCQSSKSAA